MTRIRRRSQVGPLLRLVCATAAALVILLIAATPAQAARDVRVGTYDYAPLVSLDATGKPVGLYVDLIEQIAAGNDWHLTYVHGSWNENLEWLESGRIDLVLDIAQTPERAARYNLNRNPVVPTWSQIDVRPDSTIATVRDLEGQRIAVNSGDVTYAATQKLAGQWNVHPVFVVVDTTSEQYQLLSRDEVAAVATDNVAAVAYEQKYGAKPTSILYAPFTTGFGTARGRNLDLLAAIDRYIEAQAGDPSSKYNITLDEWLEAPPKTDERLHAYLIWSLAGVAGLATLLVGTSALLRRQVRRRTREIRLLNADLEQRVAARTAALEAANRELESFAYSVSHDLRAPLRALDGFSRVLSEDHADELGEAAQGYLGRIRTAAQKMSALIDGLLELSRLSRSELRRQRIDVGELAGAIVEELREAEPGRPVEVVIAEGLSVYGDRNLVRGLLANLIGNAWKFSATHETARIEVGEGADGDAGTEGGQATGETVVFVRDDGVGFDMAYADKLFAPFQRLHSPEQFEGTGIGLATAQRIVARHGGRIWAESEVGKGATFFAALPEPE